MNKAMMFPIHKNWVEMIFDGTKKFEFRNKLPKDLNVGMKIYFYETLGNMKQGITPVSETNPMPRYWCSYEGTGQVVGEATVKEIYVVEQDVEPTDFLYTLTPIDVVKLIKKNNCSGGNDLRILDDIDKIELTPYGFTNQQYAIELTDIIKYDEDWIGNIERDLQRVAENINYFDKLEFAPTEPIDKSEFVLWNSNKNINFNIQCPIYVFEK